MSAGKASDGAALRIPVVWDAVEVDQTSISRGSSDDTPPRDALIHEGDRSSRAEEEVQPESIDDRIRIRTTTM